MSTLSTRTLLRELVAIPSVNPTGRPDLPASITGEKRCAEHVAGVLRRLGLDAGLIGTGERASVVGLASVPGATETVLVASHLDTVPVDGMEIDPFDPVIEGDRLRGRGSCDTKGGMAAALVALGEALAHGRLRRNVMIVGEADEEAGSAGVRDVLAHLGARRASFAIVTEPTQLRVVTHHKGIAVARLEARGVACHSSDPTQGRNAIALLARAVLALDALGARLAAHGDPVLGPGTLSVGQIGGGAAPNIVPDHAWLHCDRRLLPGESDATARAEIEQSLREAGLADDVRVVLCAAAKPPLGEDRAGACVRVCRAAVAAEGGDDTPGAVAFGTDAGLLAAAGIPAVVFGPGSIEQAHTAREWVSLDEVERAARMLRRVFEGAEAGPLGAPGAPAR